MNPYYVDIETYFYKDIAGIIYGYLPVCNRCEYNKQKFLEYFIKHDPFELLENIDENYSTLEVASYDLNKLKLIYESQVGSCDYCFYKETDSVVVTIDELICCITHAYGIKELIRNDCSDMISNHWMHTTAIFKTARYSGYKQKTLENKLANLCNIVDYDEP